MGLTAVSLSNGGAVQFKTFTNALNQRWEFIDVSTDAYSSNTPSPDIQNKTQWCWATSTKVAVKHNYGKVSPRITSSPQRLDYTEGARSSYCGTNSSGALTADGVQRAIVIQVRKNDTNLYGRVEDTEQALEFADPDDDDADYRRAGNPGYTLSSSDKNLFKSKVQEGDYIVAGFGIKNANIGHVVVITGYDSVTKKYSLYDPWDGTPLTIIEDDIFAYSNPMAGDPYSKYGLEYFFYKV